VRVLLEVLASVAALGGFAALLVLFGAVLLDLLGDLAAELVRPRQGVACPETIEGRQ
jgi:hypothetical protein